MAQLAAITRVPHPRSYLYRWRPADWCRAHPTQPSFSLHALECGYKKGNDKLHLRLPQVRIFTASVLF